MFSLFVLLLGAFVVSEFKKSFHFHFTQRYEFDNKQICFCFYSIGGNVAVYLFYKSLYCNSRIAKINHFRSVNGFSVPLPVPRELVLKYWLRCCHLPKQWKCFWKKPFSLFSYASNPLQLSVLVITQPFFNFLINGTVAIYTSQTAFSLTCKSNHLLIFTSFQMKTICFYFLRKQQS